VSCFYAVELSPRYESDDPRIIKVGRTDGSASNRMLSFFTGKFSRERYTPFLLREITLSKALTLDLELKVKRRLSGKGFACINDTSEFFKVNQGEIDLVLSEIDKIHSKLINNSISYKSSNLGLAQAFESYRTKEGLTQKELALICGSTQSTVSKILRGSRDIRISTAQKMLDHLDLEFAIIKRVK